MSPAALLQLLQLPPDPVAELALPLVVCAYCPEGDNEWCVSAFRGWASIKPSKGRPVTPQCLACLLRRNPKVYRGCTTCAALMYAHPHSAHVRFPRCFACRDWPACAVCCSDLRGRVSIDVTPPNTEGKRGAVRKRASTVLLCPGCAGARGHLDSVAA